MRKIMVIAARDYRAAVKTKAFVVSLVIMPLLVGGSILAQRLTAGQVDITEKRFAVVDRSPGQAIYHAVAAAARERNEKQIFDPTSKVQTKPVFLIEHVVPSEGTSEAILQQRFDLSERIRRQELFALLEIGPDVTRYETGAKAPSPTDDNDRAQVRYQSNSPTFDAFQDWVHTVLNEAVEEKRFAAKNIKLETGELQEILIPVRFRAKGLTQKSAETGKIEDAPDQNRIASFVIPVILFFMMYMLILIGSTPLMQSVVEEKMQRIAEVLLGSVRPFELMMGKLIGMVGVALTLAAVYLGGGYWTALHMGFAHYIPVDVLVCFVVYQALAVLMFGSLFVAVGAACTDMRETQAMMWPVMILIISPTFVWMNVLKEPTSAFSTWISFVPFCTPMIMLGRQAVPPGIPLWQPVLGMVVMLGTTVVCVYIAGRIFRVGILMQGKGAKIGELVKWVIRG